MGVPKRKIPAMQGTISPAVPKSDESATVPFLSTCRLQADDSTSISPEKDEIRIVRPSHRNPCPARTMSKSPKDAETTLVNAVYRKKTGDGIDLAAGFLGEQVLHDAAQ